ncbi:type VII secretion protein EccB [Streptomyces sp. P1-3]|uniref:type VII secretion protein EccB n=1 Tax=Streptomyces sp. P1-3 TaxID=3421658 RepID=UPI003D36C21F
MASRRDELNAYTFAKRRTVTSFLQPSLGATGEPLPRPLRAVMPSLVVGALIVAGFGAWGMFRPTAPKGWDEPESHVIVGSSSTTRYVVLETDGKKQLHPVLNFASAKLLLAPEKSSIVKVKESVLDDGHIPRGPTLGIPYAPDRMPSADEAGKKKSWAVCEQPGGNNKTTQKAVFLFSHREVNKVEGQQRLHGGQALYVEGKDGRRYLVDPHGKKYLIKKPGGGTGGQESAESAGYYNLLLRTVFDDGAKPQKVTEDWLNTFTTGPDIDFPVVPGSVGGNAGLPDLGKANRVGMVLEASTGTDSQRYVVLPGKVARVSDFVADLLLNSKQLKTLGQNGVPKRVHASTFVSEEEFSGGKWPTEEPRQANAVNPEGAGATNDTICSILEGVSGNGTPQLGTWAGRDYPAEIVDGATSAYVTPGTGLLYRQVQGKSTVTGPVFLVTDTGLRYQVQSNGDSSADKSKIGNGDKKKDEKREAKQADEARTRLGYKDVEPVPVPVHWSQFLPIGPKLDTNSARQPQGA